MKVFISWSGARSQLLADALREWIHDVVQSVECFSSTEDIRAGQRWNNEINSWLNDTDFGVLCVTQENVTSPWLNFEAGALAKKINDDARVVPVTLGFAPAALDDPLKQFNGVRADKQGIYKLIDSIAESSKATIDLNKAFEWWWPDLDAKIAGIPDAEDQVEAPALPEVPDMFSDIMASMRGLTNEMRELGRYVARPQTGRTSSEVRAMATVLAREEALRDDVSRGVSGALEYLRKQVRGELAETRRLRGEEAVRRILDEPGNRKHYESDDPEEQS